MADQGAKEPTKSAANVHESIEARTIVSDAPARDTNETSQSSSMSQNPPNDAAPAAEKSPDPDVDADGDIDMDVDPGTKTASGDIKATTNPSVTINLKDGSEGTAKVDEKANKDDVVSDADADADADSDADADADADAEAEVEGETNTENKPAAKASSEAGVEADAPSDSKEEQASNRLDNDMLTVIENTANFLSSFREPE